MKRVLFIDRDGTIIVEPADEQIDSFDKMEFLPGVISYLSRIAKKNAFELVMVTNQDGLGTKSFPEDTFWPVQNLMLKILQNEGIVFDEILIDRSFPKDNAPTRKPRTGLLSKYMTGNYDLENSYVIGDRESDIQLAKNLGAKSILISDKDDPTAELVTSSWEDIYQHLFYPPRIASVTRKTNETKIELSVNIDGTGNSKIKSGLGFLDHMLELLARHSLIDIKAKINGDLHVDEHHTVEDTAIVLGEAINKALGDKRGIDRYGFLLPMDESHAYAAIDFSGRPELTWKVEFRREMVGNMPTELFYHFFKSFCDHARCTLLVKAKGKNEHHKIEAIFKAVAKSIKNAVKQDPDSDQIPSTKGAL
jgi:imidazoleglycerol-phosphate dehydratase / histidinol-phosphatase